MHRVIYDRPVAVKKQSILPSVPSQSPANPDKWNRLIYVGEAGGQEEAKAGMPFVGAAGKLLNKLSRIAGIERMHTYVTNVFNYTPPNNDLRYFFRTGKADSSTLQLKAKYRTELSRLYQEIHNISPAVVIAWGKVACWALLSRDLDAALSPIVGKVLINGSNNPVIPLYHPAYLLRKECSSLQFHQTILALKFAVQLAQRMHRSGS